jgi:hypothetical protein
MLAILLRPSPHSLYKSVCPSLLPELTSFDHDILGHARLVLGHFAA